jgi:adenylate cyclase
MSTVFSRLHKDIKNGTSTRIELVGFVVILFAFLSHCCFLALFYTLKVWPMFYFNIISVVLFAILFFTFRKSDSYLPQYIISAIEVIAHQIAADYYVGVQTGFHYYIILFALIACLELEKHIKLSVFFASVCAVCFLAVEVGMMDLTPVYILPELIVKILKTVNIGFSLIIIVVIEYVFIVTVSKAEHSAETQYERAERLLNNILPHHIVNRLKVTNTNSTIADSYDSVAVLFLDIVDFTNFSSHLEANAIVTVLNSLFSLFDEATDKYHVEKIKTSGDSYIAATGIPFETNKQYENIALYALELEHILAQFNKEHHSDFKVRIGIHCGPVAAGVIGKKKFIYDLWGSTVNFAARMETTGISGRIQVSEAMYNEIKDSFILEERAPIPVKSFGMCTNYFLKGIKK